MAGFGVQHTQVHGLGFSRQEDRNAGRQAGRQAGIQAGQIQLRGFQSEQDNLMAGLRYRCIDNCLRSPLIMHAAEGNPGSRRVTCRPRASECQTSRCRFPRWLGRSQSSVEGMAVNGVGLFRTCRLMMLVYTPPPPPRVYLGGDIERRC